MCLEQFNEGFVCPMIFSSFDVYIRNYEKLHLEELRDDIERAPLKTIKPFFPLQIEFPSDLEVDVCSYPPCGNSLYRDYAVCCKVEQDRIFCSHECRLGDWICTSSNPTEYPKRFDCFLKFPLILSAVKTTLKRRSTTSIQQTHQK